MAMMMTPVLMRFDGPTFQMDVPSDWVVSASPQFQAIFLGPTDQPIRPNLLVALRPVEQGVSVYDVAENARQTQQGQYPQYQVLAEIDFREYGGEGLLRRYYWVDPNRGEGVIQFQAFFMLGNVLHTLTATRSADLPEALGDEMDQILNGMLQSFRFKTQPA